MSGQQGNEPQRALGKMVVGTLITSAAKRFRDREAIYCVGTGRRFTYRQCNERCNRLANALDGLGLKKPTVVAFLCNNRAELMDIYFAIAKLGLIGIPLNYRLAPAEIVELTRAMGAQALLFETRFAGAAEQVRSSLPAVKSFIAIGDGRPDWAMGYEDLLARSSTAEPEAEVEEHDAFYYNLTSGTTGLPKCYTLTHFNNAAMGPMFESFDTTSNDVFMTVFPAFGRVGYGWIAAGLQFGARNVLMDFNPAEVLRLIGQERVTIMNLVATMGAMLLAEPTLAKADLSSLRGLVFAGSMFPAPLRERIAARLCPGIYEYYGMQETGALTTSTPADRAVREDSIGLPLPFVELRIERSDGSTAAPGELGEIVARSPTAVTHYYDNPAKSAETFAGGWVHTGDLGMIDEEGFLFIRGRLKDMIISGGQNVHAAEIEETVLTFPGVTDCAVFGLPDEMWGERVAALVVVDAAREVPTVEALQAYCRERLAGFKIPRTVIFDTQALPRTPTGKVQKFLLVERYGQDSAAQ
ncbi:MAG: AMP-binding protein [Bradyrhizobium sp.]|uniref:class I adenylate-forming enzyme family protein n=1 Tax=Bradyrhizobium sp. TaxID=376 RepID=UPI0025C1442F|nr:AMP-binding protein [Bradyrhizobium sp.]MBI5263028.1 AMP-binding protein [Bradyrhizobium sp.]